MKKNLAVFFAVLVFLGAGAMAGTAHADLVVNGGFETGDTTGWVFTPASNGSDFFIATNGSLDIPPYAGNYYAAFGAVGNLDDTITQTLATTAGQSYTFSFALAHDSTNNQNDFNASWNGTPVLALSNTASFGWTQYSFTEVATGSSTTISLAGRDVPAWYGLDNVSVVQGSPVPIPGALLLFGPGLVGLAAIRRRFGK